MGIISRVFCKPAQISLVREGETFYLLAYYDGQLAPIGSIVEKWPELQEIVAEVADAGALRNVVPISRFVCVRARIGRLKEKWEKNRKLSFYLSSEIERVEVLSEPPDWLVARYRREGSALVRMLPEDVVELEDGWLRRQSAYWRYEKLPLDGRRSFGRERIPVEDWVRFVTVDLPAYRAAGIKVDSQIEYDDRRAFQLELLKCAEESIEVRTTWNVGRETVDESVALDGFVLSADRIRPGLLPSAVQAVLPSEIVLLEGQSLASFLDEQYASLRKWFSSDLSEFDRVHTWIAPPYSWILVARSKLTRGVGRAHAHPVACVGENLLSVEELQGALREPYTRLTGGWVRRSDLLTLWMDEDARCADGTEVKPIRLDAELLLHCGGRKLGSMWSAMRCEGAEWIDSGDKHSCAKKHLAYLLHWGINGGLIGGYEAMVAYGIPLLAEIGEGERGCKILLLGGLEDIRELTASHPYVASMMRDQDFLCTDYDSAARNAELKRKRWDLLMLIEPDAYASDVQKQAIRGAAAASAACKIGFFARMPRGDAELRSWDAGLLGHGSNAALIDVLIRDGRDPKPLPERYVFAPQIKRLPPAERAEVRREPVAVRPLQGGGAELILGEAAGAGAAIPPRSGAEAARTAVALENPHRAFFDEARRFAEFEGEAAEPVPFACYWPKYSDMSAPQREWYFHLRSCIRRGEYPETDLSYLFVYIYEILNLIGVRDAAEGYRILLKLRSAYGEAHLPLHHHLDGWLYDYIHVYDCGVDLGQLLTDLQQLPERGLNELLTEMATQEELNLPLWALERLSKYRITNSKFYQRGNQELMDRCIPGALREVDRQLRRQGKGLLDTYAALKIHNDTFSAFEGALVEVQRSYQLRCRHYQSGLKLSMYLKNAVRYTENALRAQQKFGAKLQGVELDARSRAWIDAYVAQQGGVEAGTQAQRRAPARISLDLKKLDQLRVDSDEVRDALIASMAEEAPRVEEIAPIERPEGAAEGLLTDLAPVQGILARLTPVQSKLLDCLAARAWRADVRVLREELAVPIPEVLVEEIDELAVTCLGCFLIEREGDAFVVAEDYRDELEYLMPRRAQEADAWRVNFDGLDEDWRILLSQADVAALGKLLEGIDAFREYARARGEMPELLLDELNNLAADAIGDLIVDDGGICEDYLEVIQGHIVKG